MTQCQAVAILLGVYRPDPPVDGEPEAAPMIGELDKAARQQQMLGGPLVVEAHTRQHDAVPQVAFYLHQGMHVAKACAFLHGGVEPRAADAPEDERSVTHRLHEPKYFGGFAREAAPHLRPRHEFQNFRVVIVPEPAVLAGIFRLRYREVSCIRRDIDRTIEMAHEKFGSREGVCRQLGHS